MTKYLRNKHLTYFTQDTQKKKYLPHITGTPKKKSLHYVPSFS